MSNAPRSSLSVRLYTRENCPLCDEMKTQVGLAGLAADSVELVDIGRDPVTAERFRWRIPVLEIQGRVAFEGRCEAAQIVEHLARIQADAGRA